MRCLLLLAAAAVGFAGLAQAGPVPSTGPLPSKIEELENAVNLFRQNKIEESYKQVQEACKKYPSLAPARLIMARMFLQANAQNARQVLELAATENPEHPEVFLTLAGVALGDGRVSDTILNSQRVLELSANPRWTADQKGNFQREARAALAGAYEFRRDWANMRAQMAALVELEPKNGQIRQRFATSLFQLGKVDEAFAEFQTAVKDDPVLLPAAVLMARQYMAKGDFAKATEFFERAVKQEPNSSRVHVAYADFLLQQEKLDDAKAHVQSATKIDPKNIDVQRMQALTARFGRDYPTAIKILEEIRAQSPSDFFASNQLALIYADMNDPAARKKAKELAELNVSRYQQNLDAMSTLGYCYFRNGDVTAAQQALAKIVQAGRATPDAAYYLALVLHVAKPTDPAKQAEAKQAVEDAKNLLKSALESKDLFFFRKEARALHEQLLKESPAAAPGGKAKG